MRFTMKHNGYIAGEGFPFIIPLAIATLLAFLAGFRGISLILLLVTLFVVWFFRNPQRQTPEKEGLVISPADGKVIRIEETTCDVRPGRTFQKISIFMNVFNVHVNRMPCSGEVLLIHYRKGKFLSADLDKASALNERNTILLQTADGREIVTVQIAGLIARRIVCWLKEGMQATRGERFGLIRFGSRVEVFLPLGSTIFVKVGDKVRAGETPIGDLT
jgi:phosphatidylserine decarboxylase